MPSDHTLASIQPVVLVGGRSSRFGRNKLLEPLADVAAGVMDRADPGRRPVVLVDRPITALRAVFGARVACVGECPAEVRARFDACLEDLYPGAGPAGGVLSALEASRGPVFVLAGDLFSINAETVGLIAGIAAAAKEVSWAVLARSDRVEPCVGMYSPGAIACLRAAIEGRAPLHRAIPDQHRLEVPVDAGWLRNINTQSDLSSTGSPGEPGSSR